MKKLLFLVLTVLIVSCSKDDSNPAPSPTYACSLIGDWSYTTNVGAIPSSITFTSATEGSSNILGPVVAEAVIPFTYERTSETSFNWSSSEGTSGTKNFTINSACDVLTIDGNNYNKQ